MARIKRIAYSVWRIRQCIWQRANGPYAIRAGLIWLAVMVAGCQGAGVVALPTLAAAVPTLPPMTPALPANTAVPPTWTPLAVAQLPVNDPFEPLPEWTPQPTPTPWPTWTPAPLPTNTSRPLPTPVIINLPTAGPPPATATVPGPITVPTGPNLLPNPSFEGGWYHIDGIPELQIPSDWQLDWDEGANPLDPDPWNRFVRPEVRVLPADFLPSTEWPLYIWDGEQTVKIFKGMGALSFSLTAEVYVDPGIYELEVHVFPDMVMSYTVSGAKVWADDPLAGEVKLLAGGKATNWILPEFGQKNTFTFVFDVPAGQNMRVGAAFRGRWAILNNGWFMDDWSLHKVGG